MTVPYRTGHRNFTSDDYTRIMAPCSFEGNRLPSWTSADLNGFFPLQRALYLHQYHPIQTVATLLAFPPLQGFLPLQSRCSRHSSLLGFLAAPTGFVLLQKMAVLRLPSLWRFLPYENIFFFKLARCLGYDFPSGPNHCHQQSRTT